MSCSPTSSTRGSWTWIGDRPPAGHKPRHTAAGLRKNELRSLKVAHLSLDPCGLRLEPEWTKNREPGFQPLPQVLVEKLALENARKASADPLLHVPRHVDRGFDADLEAAGIRT